MAKVGIRAALSRRQQKELDRVLEAGRRKAAAQLNADINENLRKAKEALAAGDHRAARAYADQVQASVFVRAMQAGGVEMY
ncbi:hypothetical protein [Nocardia sp. NPDC127526]|uniref:hypothetical protein n=1 Tax=Nocardia sp. NPDC127526 TaxID=3345393 RepID=UPI00363CA85B